MIFPLARIAVRPPFRFSTFTPWPVPAVTVCTTAYRFPPPEFVRCNPALPETLATFTLRFVPPARFSAVTPVAFAVTEPVAVIASEPPTWLLASTPWNIPATSTAVTVRFPEL